MFLAMASEVVPGGVSVRLQSEVLYEESGGRRGKLYQQYVLLVPDYRRESEDLFI
jgi:hypothetical protein